MEAVELNEKSPAAQWVGEIADADGIDPRTIRSVGDVLTIAKRVEEDNSNPGIRYNLADDGWAISAPSKLDDVIYALQDKHVDTKRVEQANAEQRAGAIRSALKQFSEGKRQRLDELIVEKNALLKATVLDAEKAQKEKRRR